jgi:hypothetical protein
MDDIDTIIATKIMGWVVHPRNTSHWMDANSDPNGYKPIGQTCGSDRFQPSRNLIDAWKVVDKMARVHYKRINGLPWSTRFSYAFNSADLWAYTHEGAAKCICQIAIKAAGIELESNAKDHPAGESPDREA